VYVILLGPPGAGKGTQAVALAERLEAPHVASGDLFREALGKGTELGLLAKSYMERGALVPDEVTTAMVKERLQKPDAAKGAVLDGFPRTIEQAKALDKALADEGKAIDKVLLIDVPNDELLKRLSGRWICRNCQEPYHEQSRPPKKAGVCDNCGGELYQRADDTVETARRRLEVYAAQTAPLIDYYKKAGKLAAVNGNQPIAAVEKELLKAVGK
jgi:adenylate kinase